MSAVNEQAPRSRRKRKSVGNEAPAGSDENQFNGICESDSWPRDEGGQGKGRPSACNWSGLTPSRRVPDQVPADINNIGLIVTKPQAETDQHPSQQSPVAFRRPDPARMLVITLLLLWCLLAYQLVVLVGLALGWW